MKKITVLIVILLLLPSCATFKGAVHVKCPALPVIHPVEVTKGQIQGENLESTIKNHMSAWKHIHILRKLGCTEK